MAKVLITNELVDLIRSIRVEKKMTAKRISQSLQKSDSYIAKLEAGKIRSLSLEDLESIFSMLLDGDKNKESILEVAFCSTTFALAPGQSNLIFKVFPCSGRGSFDTSIFGINAAPIIISTQRVNMAVKFDFISCYSFYR